MRTTGNGINVTLFMGARTGAGESKWGRICQHEMVGDSNDDRGGHYLWKIEVPNVEYFEGDFIYAWIRCDQQRLFVMSERGTSDWDQSYFEITTNPENLTQPEEPIRS